MALLRIEGLPDEPLAAAATFHARWLGEAQEALGTLDGALLVLVFAPADHTHRDWRLAAVRGLARQAAPARVNGVESDEDRAIAAAVEYLANAPGVTGQYLPLDGIGAGLVLSRPA